MKKEIKRKYHPFNYHQDIYLKIQNFKQQNLSVEEYSAKFKNLMIKGDLQEAEEQSIACYLAGMRFEISRVIYLQPYITLQEVMKLALKVEALNKYGSSITTRSTSKEGFIKSSTARSHSGTKTTLKPHVKSDVLKSHQELTYKSRRCFKFQGLGHMASECPNRRVVALVEKEEAEEEDVEEEVECDHEDELTISLVSQRSLKIGAVASVEDWLQSNVFHTRCTSKGKVCLVIIDSEIFENCVSMKMVQKLDLKMIPHPKPYNLCCLQKGNDIKVKHRCLFSFTSMSHAAWEAMEI